jgi:hypothetical protein
MELSSDLGDYRCDYRRRKWLITGGARLVGQTLCGASDTMKAVYFIGWALSGVAVLISILLQWYFHI